MKITLLGTGTSQGVPVIACKCNICTSCNPKDKRLRSSVMIEVDNTTIVIDTGPDFRQQMLRENVDDIDAILYTHHHKDHVAGMDDIRAFNHKWKKDIQVYCTNITSNALRNEFPYIFDAHNYPGVPKVNINLFENKIFKINNIEIIPIKALHYKMRVFGFRINKFVYLTDISDISQFEKEKIKGADILILDSLQRKQHISHFNLEQSINLIEEIKPKKALLTHISHHMGLHNEVNKELPSNIQLSFDGQTLNIN